EPPQTSLWLNLLQSNFDNLDTITILSSDRKLILEKILDYYQLHIEGFGQIKSHYILEEVLN
ncbi:MAG: DNA repair protein RecO, partial [Daejeonella sp.]